MVKNLEQDLEDRPTRKKGRESTKGRSKISAFGEGSVSGQGKKKKRATRKKNENSHVVFTPLENGQQQ